MSLRVWIYCRISSDKRKGTEGEAAGVKRQEQDCRKKAEAIGATSVTVLVENDVSASSGEARVEYERLLDAIRDGEVDTVLAYHPDRLHRAGPREFEDYVDAVEVHGVDTDFVKAGRFEFKTATGRMQARMANVLARMESEQKAERVRRAQQQAAEAGVRHGGGLRPFGYTRMPRKNLPAVYAQHPVEAPLLREAIEGVLATRHLGPEDRLTLGKVVRQWNGDGITTVTGKQWNFQLLRSVLMRDSNGGIASYTDDDGNTVEVTLTDMTDGPIVTADQQRELSQYLTRPDRRSTPSSEPKRLMSSLVMCGKCGHKMGPASVKSRGKQLMRYRCRNIFECSHSIEMFMLDRLVIDAVVDAYLTEVDPMPGPVSNTGARLAKLRAELDALAVDRKKWIGLADVMTAEEVKAKLAPLNARKREIEGAIDVLVAEDAHASMAHDVLGEVYRDEHGGQRVNLGLPDAGKLRARFEALSLAKRRTVVKSLLKVTVMPGRGAERVIIEKAAARP